MKKTVVTAVTITNKAELQETWYVETGLSRTVGISTTPAGNNFTLMQSGKMTITSSDPTVIGVSGFNITALKAGTSTITVTLTNDDNTKVTDSVAITVENRPVLSVGPVAVTEITEGEFYLGWFNSSKSTYSFITGEMSGFYGAAVDGSTQADKAAKVKIAKSGEGYTFQIITEGLSTTNQYIGADSNTNEKGTHYNFVFVEEAFVWTYDATNGVFKATVTTDENEQVEVFLGSEGNYGTASCYPMDEIGDDGIYKMTPYTFNEGYALAGKPESGKAYKLGAAVKGDPNAIQAITGDMAATYYFGTTADPEIAIDVTVTEAENGWTLAPEGKGYIGATVSGTHTNIVYQEDPYYWTWNDELATFTTELTVGDATEVVAPGMEGTHDTIGVYDISNLDGINVASIYNAYYIATEEEVMTEGPIWTAPEDGVAMKFGAYNDSVANEGYWMINGEMDGEYFKTIETSKKDAWSEAVDVTPHKVTDGWTLQLASGKYIGAKAIYHDEVDEEGNPDRWYTYRPEYTDTAFVWQYEEDTKAFVTTISGLNTEVVESGSIKLFLGGQSKFTTGSVSDYKYVGSNLKMGFFTWGEYDLEEPDEPVDTYEPTGTPVTLDFTKTEFTAASDNVSLSLTEVTINYEGLNFVWKKAESRSDIALNDEGTALKYTAPTRFYVGHTWTVTAPAGYAISAVVADAVSSNLFDNEHVEVTAPTNAVFHHDTEIELPTPASTFECKFKVQARANNISFYLVPVTAA